MENKKSTRESAKQLLIRQLADHNVNVKIDGRLILIDDPAKLISYSIHFCSTKGPSHAGGKGRIHLKWSIKESIEADIYALIDLSGKRTWLFNKTEIKELSQQHNNNTNHLYMFVDRMAPNPKNYSYYHIVDFSNWLIDKRIHSIISANKKLEVHPVNKIVISKLEGKQSNEALTKELNPSIKNFNDLFHSVQRCKLAKTCLSREVRQFYYANDKTALNHKVMFICESPATRLGSRNGSFREENWVGTKEDLHFRYMLKKIDCGGAYITNFIKCGTLARCKLSEFEISTCIKFLYSEINLIKPKLLVVVGGKTKSLTKKYLKTNIPIISVTHYSWRRRPNYNSQKELDSYLKVKNFLDDL